MSTVPAYEGNVLIDACGPILSQEAAAKWLTHLPPLPLNPGAVEPHIRLHQMVELLSLYVPTPESIQVAMTLDLLVRRGYVARDPRNPQTWRRIYGEGSASAPVTHFPLAGAVFGVSGTGKSIAIERSLAYYDQTVVHRTFPNMAGPFKQVTWLKIDVPGSGNSVDLASSLMIALDRALGTDHFQPELSRRNKNGANMLRMWQQRALAHFLGPLVLDEIQNLFKLDTKKNREKAARKDLQRPALRIADDEALKFLLTYTNTFNGPLLISGTPDGLEAFASRFSTSQRLVTGGHHEMQVMASPDDLYFKKYLFPVLARYQWFGEVLRPTDSLRTHVHNLSGGVPRIVANLWLYAQRCALERKAKSLDAVDFDRAMDTYMSPLKPAVAALKSDDPRKLLLYEDLIPRSHPCWSFAKGSK